MATYSTENCTCCGGICIPCPCCGEEDGVPLALSHAVVTLPTLVVCGFDNGCDLDCGFENVCTTNPGIVRKYNEIFGGVPVTVNVRSAACTLDRLLGPYPYDAVESTEFCDGNDAGYMWVQIKVEIQGSDPCVLGVTWTILDNDEPDPDTASIYLSLTADDGPVPLPINCNAGYIIENQFNQGECGDPYEANVTVELHSVPCPVFEE